MRRKLVRARARHIIPGCYKSTQCRPLPPTSLPPPVYVIPAPSHVIPPPSHLIPAPTHVIPAPTHVIPAKAGIQTSRPDDSNETPESRVRYWRNAVVWESRIVCRRR